MSIGADIPRQNFRYSSVKRFSRQLPDCLKQPIPLVLVQLMALPSREENDNLVFDHFAPVSSTRTSFPPSSFPLFFPHHVYNRVTILALPFFLRRSRLSRQEHQNSSTWLVIRDSSRITYSHRILASIYLHLARFWGFEGGAD